MVISLSPSTPINQNNLLYPLKLTLGTKSAMQVPIMIIFHLLFAIDFKPKRFVQKDTQKWVRKIPQPVKNMHHQIPLNTLPKRKKSGELSYSGCWCERRDLKAPCVYIHAKYKDLNTLGKPGQKSGKLSLILDVMRVEGTHKCRMENLNHYHNVEYLY